MISDDFGTEAYEKFTDHQKKKQTLLRKVNTDVVSILQQRGEIEKEIVSTYMEDKPVTSLEKKLKALDDELASKNRILAGLKNYQDDGLEQSLINDAVDEIQSNILAGKEDLEQILNELEEKRDALFPIIEEYLHLRRAVREEAEKIRELKESGYDLKTDIGRIEALNLARIPELNLSEIRKRFGSLTR